MARRKPKSRRNKSQSQKRRTPVKSDSQQAAQASAQDAAQSSTKQGQGGLADEELAETYGYVRRDLLRIAVLALIMFTIIFVSPFFLM